jgi:anti-anti-sigma factor
MSESDRSEVLIATADDGVTVILRGEIDDAAADQLNASLDEALAESRDSRLVVDCADVTFMDSAGLNALVRAHRHGAGRITLSGPSRQVERAFEISGVDKLIEPQPQHALERPTSLTTGAELMDASTPWPPARRRNRGGAWRSPHRTRDW